MLTTVLQQLLIFCCDREPKIWTSERIVGFVLETYILGSIKKNPLLQFCCLPTIVNVSYHRSSL